MKNFTQMMKQAQELQGRMAEMQAEMERTIVEGRSGGGMVMVLLNGKGDMTGVKIDPSLLKPGEGEILEDLVVAAHTDAKSKVEEIVVFGEAEGAVAFSSLMVDASAPDVHIDPAEDLVALPYSSGTTGFSKGVMLTHRNLVANLVQTTACINITEDEAIKWLTINPAWALGLDDKIGSIEVGKNADVVLWSGNPFSIYTRAEKVWIDGALLFDRSDPTEKWRTDFELGTVKEDN